MPRRTPQAVAGAETNQGETMIEQYSLPPGYHYEALPDGESFGIVDRAANVVMHAPLESGIFGFFDAICTMWQILESSPELAGIHTAAFLTWRLGDSPLGRLDQ